MIPDHMNSVFGNRLAATELGHTVEDLVIVQRLGPVARAAFYDELQNVRSVATLDAITCNILADKDTEPHTRRLFLGTMPWI